MTLHTNFFIKVSTHLLLIFSSTTLTQSLNCPSGFSNDGTFCYKLAVDHSQCPFEENAPYWMYHKSPQLQNNFHIVPARLDENNGYFRVVDKSIYFDKIISCGNTQAIHQNPNIGHQNPNADIENPSLDPLYTNIGHDDPNVNHEDPNVDHADPNVDHEDPNVDHEDPNVDHDDPNLDQEIPNFDQEIPNFDQPNPNLDQQNPYYPNRNPHDGYENPYLGHQRPNIFRNF